MRRTYFGKLPAYQFHSLQKFSDQIDHAVLTRGGGFSAAPYDSLNLSFSAGDSHEAVKRNRQLVLDAMGYDRLVSANQTHSKNVRIVDSQFLQKADEDCDGTDAFVTDVPEALLLIKVADCQALLMYEPEHKVIGAVHAGWKGLVQDISGETIRVMVKDFGARAENIMVAIAPSLGPCCAFFSNPEEELPVSFHAFIDKKKRVDLWEYSLKQLQGHGIKKGNIELARVCTQCSKRGDFYSFRGQHGITGRFGAVIGLRG